MLGNVIAADAAIPALRSSRRCKDIIVSILKAYDSEAPEQRRATQLGAERAFAGDYIATASRPKLSQVFFRGEAALQSPMLRQTPVAPTRGSGLRKHGNITNAGTAGVNI
jgi:hypothetical protein